MRKYVLEDVGGGDGAGDGAEGGEGGAEVFGDEIGGDAGGESGAGTAEGGGRFSECFVVAEVGHEGRIFVADAGFDELLKAVFEIFQA